MIEMIDVFAHSTCALQEPRSLRPDRLRLAEKIGAIPIDDSHENPVAAVMKHTNSEGADHGCECGGWQCHDPAGHVVPNDTMNKLVKSVRATGSIGVIGVFAPRDSKPTGSLMKHGQIAFDFGLFFEKGLWLLCALVAEDKAKSSFLVSHVLPLEKAPDAYKHFDARDDGWTKVILRPAA